MKSPVVSVLMTAYNREKYIAHSIESVLLSTFSDFELVIVDDASSDNTVEIARKYAREDHRIKVFVNEINLGDYLNRNKAASYASGMYLKYLDSDDVIYPYGLEAMVLCMNSFPMAGFGLSAVGDFKQPFPICLSPREAYIQHFSGQGHFSRAPGSSIILKAAFDYVGGFSGRRQVGDFEFWLKIACYFPMVKLPVDLYWSRIHEGRESNVHNQRQKQKLSKLALIDVFNTENVPLNEKEKKRVLNMYD